MGVRLPAALEAAIEQRLVGVSRADLAERAARISSHYRAQGASSAVVKAEADAAAYALSRLPATFAAVDAAFEAIARRAPHFAPVTVLDVGAGPGGASWAAVDQWPGVAAVALLDSNRAFLALAEELARSSDHPALAASRPVLADFRALTAPPEPADLVVASYALAEAPASEAVATARTLWGLAQGVLVVVEPGTPAGFERIAAVRAALIAEGGGVIAPCPHADACPITAPGWCHFNRRLPRSRDHRLVKGADAPFEDERFAYVALARPGIQPRGRGERVLSTPRITKVEVAYRACTPKGLAERRIPRREREGFARARRLDWGDWAEEG